MTNAATLERPTSISIAVPPDRSYLQRMEALDRANDIRFRRAQVKRDLKGGRVEFGDLVADPPACLETAKVYALLLHVPKVGRVKAQKVLAKLQVSPSKTFGGLSTRQRREFDDLMRRHPGFRKV